ncbi:MAG: hypothetical protein ACYSUI_21195, partial [Planctomycetota bacterium]
HDVIGLPAGSHDGISTGFDYIIHQRLHIAATAWNAFAQLGFDPYSQGFAASAAGESRPADLAR